MIALLALLILFISLPVSNAYVATAFAVRTNTYCKSHNVLPASNCRLALPSRKHISLSAGVEGLDTETLNALGNIQELNDAADALTSSTPDTAVVVSIVNKLASSPAILAVPIGAGFLVAFAIGFFIYSYGKGSD